MMPEGRFHRAVSRLLVLGLLTACLTVPTSPAAAAADPGGVSPQATQPPRGDGRTHVIFLLIDGCRADVFYRLLDAGRLPNIARHVTSRGLRVERCVTVFPSTTGPAYAPFISGLLPGSSGLPGIRWYDRTTGRSTVYAGREFARINQDLAPSARTIYELLPPEDSLSIFGMVDRGVTRHKMPLLELGVSKLRHDNLAVDRSLFKALWNEGFGRAPIPRFMFASFHAPDSVGHAAGVEDPGYTQGIEQVDRFVGMLADLLKNMGLYDSTYFVLSADHGQSSVSRRGSLGKLLENYLGLQVRDSIGRETAPYNTLAGSNRKRYDVHVEVSGNACVQFYLNPVGTDPSLRVLTGGVLGFPSRGGHIVNIEDMLLRSGAVELAMSRIVPGRYRIASPSGVAELLRSGPSIAAGSGAPVSPVADSYAYAVVSGVDPLGYTTHPATRALANGQPHGADAWFAATETTDFPDAPLEIAQLLESPRAGDVVITAVRGFEPWEEGQAGVHGGLRKEHMLIPLVIGGPGMTPKTLPRARSADVYPTICEILGLAPAPSDGRALPWR